MVVAVGPRVPERGDHLAHGKRVGVVTDETQQEDAVGAQVLARELARLVAVFGRVEPLQVLEVAHDVVVLVRAGHGARDPDDEAVDGEQGHADDPEPEEHEDLLVVQVDGQGALHRVAVHVTQPAHVEVAHGDPGEGDEG